MQQFFIDTIENAQLSKAQIRQCKTVLRMNKDDMIRIVDKNGKGYLARFENDNLDQLILVEPLVFPKKKAKVTLIMSLIRAEALELTIQKATELAVDHIIFYQAEHGVVRDYGKKTERKLERFATIAKEAAEQSHQQFMPQIGPIISLDEIGDHLAELNLIADVRQDCYADKLVKEAEDIAVIIGPEGGFSDHEREQLAKKGFQSLSLSPFVLRAETAAITALAQLQLVLGV